MRLYCNLCGKSVSNEVPRDTVVRAALVCPECIEKGEFTKLSANQIELRDGLAIQAAHDRLKAVVLEEVPWPFPAGVRKEPVIAAFDVLCWVLQHEHNRTFAENLEAIDAYLLSRGWALRDSASLR